MNKFRGKYYLQYGAPGTEFSGYGDGVYVGNAPLGPFEYQSHNPFSYKPGGFARGAGHGATFEDRNQNWWHVSTIALGDKNSFERRLGLWPTVFDKDDILYSWTAYGDYPHYIPETTFTNPSSLFTGWMLLNYNKPVQASSSLGGYGANFAVDEDMITYWSAASGNAGEWLQTDLGAASTIYAIQINYADQDVDSTFLGKQEGIFHQYIVYASQDGEIWDMIVDKSKSTKDVPHDYIALERPVNARYVKLVNVRVPSGKFAISGLRVFGRGTGEPPREVKDFIVLRGEHERRNAWIRWRHEPDASGYVIYCGTAPDKLYMSMMVMGRHEYYFNAMEKSKPYYFQIEAFNENGIGHRTPVLEVK
jgi:hypothetical protein